MSLSSNKNILVLTGHEDFRRRLVMSTLSGKAVKITQIRSEDTEPGLRDYEVSFLRLMESITNGSVIEISYTGTTILYKPGLIVGGTFTHNCPLSRSVGYYIEPVLLMAPFGKKATDITFKGITSGEKDLGVDIIRTSIFPVMQKFGIDRQELRIVKRGSMPKGGGEVKLHLPHLVLQPQTLHATKTPQITKLRGISYSTRVSPATVNRMIESARAVLKPTGCETFIYSDVARGEDSGLSPGFGIALVAETKAGWNISVEGIGAAGSVPEDLGAEIARKLLEEISVGGVLSRNQLEMGIIYMVLGKEDIGRVKIGKGSIDERFVRLLRDIKAFWGIELRIKEDDDGELIVTVRGTGFVSASKKIA
ncbi:18S rRNA biogenesis protein [Nadsonia fulvescens var. elongata DSM 6958]|uniref:18S rRNA biogenesis protein n=1 Tax=Nadsonia fulvescens var. elongata DSM 6958 TaxID=857566 RepID=A0A1E3PRG5_9ASCO|nr:18S rRNA biogenesis protein [Nadsonia fulvescens var. elongata DSM 6958]